MTSNLTGWPDASKPGVPMHPKRATYHWLMRDEFAAEAIPVRWQPGLQTWRSGAAQDDNLTPEQIVAEGYEYHGECLTPAEVAARVAEAETKGREAGLREAALEAGTYDCPRCLTPGSIETAILARIEEAPRDEAAREGGG